MKFYCLLSDEGDYAWQEGEEEPIVSVSTLRCEWDGISPAVEIIMGEIPARGIPFAGWPQTNDLL